MASEVFFSDIRTSPGKGLPTKLERLVKRAGIDNFDCKDKFTAIKIHFGEPGNLSFLRPNFAAKMVDILSGMGSKVFLTDCNTLYSGGRANAVDHLRSAMENGYNPLSAKAQIIIADGLKGTCYREIPLDGKYCKTPKIGSAIADADCILSLSHVKGHEMTGFGGTLKNIGMGSGSVGGKLEMHSSSRPQILPANCTGCRICEKNCAHGAIHMNSMRKAEIDQTKCVGCGQCIALCQNEGAVSKNDESLDILNYKIAEYTKAVIMGKPHFHVNFMLDISPECDCWNYNDAPIAPNIGMAASFDPVALDQACANMVNAAPCIGGGNSCTDHMKRHDGHECHDKWHTVHPDTNWRSCLEYAEEIGIGTREYKLITV